MTRGQVVRFVNFERKETYENHSYRFGDFRADTGRLRRLTVAGRTNGGAGQHRRFFENIVNGSNEHRDMKKPPQRCDGGLVFSATFSPGRSFPRS